MNIHHWLLLVLWILYGVLHSFFADAEVKQKIEKKAGEYFRYYRLCYSLVALITLIALLWYQFSLESIWLYSTPVLRFGLSLIFVITGLIVMLICIRKYFYDLSGIQALQKHRPAVTPVLQQNGLHQYVRHPLYLGTLLFVWGLFMVFPQLNHLIAASIITIYVLIGIELEEKKLLIEYGTAYMEYSKRVPKLIPQLGGK